MAATYTTTELNNLADVEASRIGALSLHTGDPGSNGANEAAGGAYVRQSVTFNAAGAVGPLGPSLQPATPGKAWSTEVTFDVPTGSYTYAGAWASTSGTFRVGNALALTQSGPGQIKLSVGVGQVLGS